MPDSAGQEKQQNSLRQTIFKNTVFATFGSVALKFLNFLFAVYVIRQLGDGRYGQYTTVLAFVGLFQIGAELGMSQYVMREIAKDRSKTQSLIWNLGVLRFLLGLLAVGYITTAAIISNYPLELVLGVLIYTSTFLLSAIQVPLQTVLTANERFDYSVAMSVAGQLTFTVLGAVFLFSGLGYLWLIVASLISLLPQIGVGLWAVLRNRLLELKPQITPADWYDLVKMGLPFGIISLTLTIAYSIDAVMLGWFRPFEMVGWYNVAYNLVFSTQFFFRGFKDAIVPSLSRTYVNDRSQVERWYFRTVKVIAILSLPTAVGGLLIADPLVRFLYTDDFLPSILALQILIWDVPFLMFNSFCGNMTTIVNEERSAARIYTINAAANVLLNLIAIPLYGYVGAAVVTVVTDIIGSVQFHFLLRKKMNLPDMRQVLVKVFAATTVMGVVVYGSANLHLFIQIGLGALVYGGMVLIVRLLDDNEWALIQRLLMRLRRSQPVQEGTK